jgi:D-glycero-D-manno-heptose 1,7-bisphosphate phosphatase
MVTIKRKAIFLDRDGVVNVAPVVNGLPTSPMNACELVVIDGIRDLVKEFKQKEYVVVVVTNQPEVARGRLKKESLKEMNDLISRESGIEHFYVCPHDDSNFCKCRKPRPGLIYDAANELNLDLERSFLVGDRWKDIEAGNAAGCRSIWIDLNYAEREPTKYFSRVSTLTTASDLILRFQHES